MLGRRGPAQAAFTNPEVRELGELTDADVVVDPRRRRARRGDARPSSSPTPPTRPTARTSRASPSSPGASRRASRSGSSSASCAPRSRSRATAGSSGSSSASTSSMLDEAGAVRARTTDGDRDDRVRDGAALDRLPRHRHRRRPYDAVSRRDPERARPRRSATDGEPHPGHYVVGWIKRGPSGVIGTNKKDAQETIETLLDDAAAGRLPEREASSATRLAEAARRARHPLRRVRRLAGDRRARAGTRRRGRPPADQADRLRGDARGREKGPGWLT